MGLQSWIATRGVKKIVSAMSKHYREGKATHPDVDEGQICQSVVGSRYQVLAPGAQEQAILSAGMESVENLYDACALVVQAETGITDPDLVELLLKCVIKEVSGVLGETHSEELEDEHIPRLLRQYAERIKAM